MASSSAAFWNNRPLSNVVGGVEGAEGIDDDGASLPRITVGGVPLSKLLAVFVLLVAGVVGVGAVVKFSQQEVAIHTLGGGK